MSNFEQFKKDYLANPASHWHCPTPPKLKWSPTQDEPPEEPEAPIYEADTYYRFSPFAKGWLATSGVMNFSERNRCYWVLDVLASYVPTLAKRKDVDYFLIVTVQVNQEDKTALFTIKQEIRDALLKTEENKGEEVLIRQAIDYTDLKENLKFWAINESPGNYDPKNQTVVLLPEEY